MVSAAYHRDQHEVAGSGMLGCSQVQQTGFLPVSVTKETLRTLVGFWVSAINVLSYVLLLVMESVPLCATASFTSCTHHRHDSSAKHLDTARTYAELQKNQILCQAVLGKTYGRQ